MALQLLTVLLEEPTDDSVEIAVNFTKEIGQVRHSPPNSHRDEYYDDIMSSKEGIILHCSVRGGL